MRCDNILESQPLSRQTSILTPAQTLPETLLFVLIGVRVGWKPVLSNRTDCKCERVQICVRLVLDSEMTPVQTAHQTWGHVGQSRSRYLVEFRCELQHRWTCAQFVGTVGEQILDLVDGIRRNHPRRRGGAGNNSIQTQIVSQEMTFLKIEVDTAE